ncbi:hypothetical protein Glove_199g40 [Diversispora epigaea]|uniref:TLDc domain-containing protein n=1 Tax=Diversispora epigaea TaxID=1348612 RepID=A0A397IRE2_9GLOM|nr:hypothetical protein Glove_199g40 [Diversispora epigaea]
MVTANELEIEKLTKKLENHFIETKSSWLKSNFFLVYRSIFSGNNFKGLEKFCNDIVAKYPSLIFDAGDFISLRGSALVSLFKRDDLQLEENDLEQYLIDSNQPVESIILPPRRIFVQNLPTQFRLILRGSVSGFEPQTFWNICNGQASTVLIMKVKGTDEILGGYNPLIWDANAAANSGDGGSWEKTNDSFIFSLKNGNIQNSILSRIKMSDYAI